MEHDQSRLDPGHEGKRAKLKFIGFALLVPGLILTIVGIASFFGSVTSVFDSGTSMGEFEGPRYFWCAFLGIPMIFAGVVCLYIVYVGSLARYAAAEMVPVATDTMNYIGQGVKGTVRDLAQSVGSGLAAGGGAAGASLLKTKACPSCGELNEPDAKFCDNCGTACAS